MKKTFISNWIAINAKSFTDNLTLAEITTLIAVLMAEIILDTPTINEQEKWIKEAKLAILMELRNIWIKP